mmetsp:Transcript_44606/g.137648  ORF Transcript_44606/g.137648 Transcript_44606/m.137648 type:complete len:262 (-) Transcript_44606:438-1223(-)
MARSISSRTNELAPRSTMDAHTLDLVPSMMMHSSSPKRCSYTFSAWPSQFGSYTSSALRSDMVCTIVPPVVLAMRRRSALFTRRTPMTPASTMYFIIASSMPHVVRMTLAPAAIILRMRSFVMSISRCLISAALDGSERVIDTPSFILTERRSKSTRAIFGFSTEVGMPCAARHALSAKPLMSIDSLADLPCCFRMPTALRGYVTSPRSLIVLTDIMASTTILEKCSASALRIFDDMDVLATLASVCTPSDSTERLRLDWR